MMQRDALRNKETKKKSKNKKKNLFRNSFNTKEMEENKLDRRNYTKK